MTLKKFWLGVLVPPYISSTDSNAQVAGFNRKFLDTRQCECVGRSACARVSVCHGEDPSCVPANMPVISFRLHPVDVIP
jgi:hypothetical protein